jgi:hypothetical protein
VDHLICWCALHDIWLSRDQDEVVAIAYDDKGDPILRYVHTAFVDAIPEQELDFERALAACDGIATKLCILKPSVAWRLNQ